MIFRPELAEMVVDGIKTQTRRPTKGKPCRYAVGQTYAVQPGRGKHSVGRITIEAVRLVTLDPLTGEDAQAEGFDSPDDFFAYWIGLYGAVDYDAEVYAITFRLAAPEVCQRCGATADPAVGLCTRCYADIHEEADDAR